MSKKQFNVRLPEDEMLRADVVRVHIRQTKEEMTRIAYAALIGTDDIVMQAKVKAAMAKAKELYPPANSPGTSASSTPAVKKAVSRASQAARLSRNKRAQ